MVFNLKHSHKFRNILHQAFSGDQQNSPRKSNSNVGNSTSSSTLVFTRFTVFTLLELALLCVSVFFLISECAFRVIM